MKRAKKIIGSALAIAALWLCSGAAHADATPAQRKEVTELTQAGANAFDEGNFLQALASFQRAYEILPVPTIGIFVARCQYALGQNSAAARTYDEIVNYPVQPTTPKPVTDAIEQARNEMPEVTSKVVRATLRVTGPTSYQVSVDGQPLKPLRDGRYAIDPGSHNITVQAAGFADGTQSVSFIPGQEPLVDFALQAGSTAPAAAAAPAAQGAFGDPSFAQDKYAEQERKAREQREQQERLDRQRQEADRKRQAEQAERDRQQREREDARSRELAKLRQPYIIPGYIVGGVGVVALGVGLIEYSSASSTASDLDSECVNGQCPASASDDLDSAKTAGNIATYSLIGGTIATGVGAYLLVKGYSIDLPTEKGAWNLSVKPGGVSLRRAF